MPVPDFQTLMLPTLEAAAAGEIAVSEARAFIAERMNLSEADLAETLKNGRQTVFVNRVSWAKIYLERAGLVETVKRGVYKATAEGIRVLESNPERVDLSVLKSYAGYRNWIERSRSSVEAEEEESPAAASPLDQAATQERAPRLTPEESLERDHASLDTTLRDEMLERLRAGSPAFFERVVVDLLVAMGYGGGRAEMGAAIGKSGDGGIDGVINEDTLGLDAVYVQAKRYAATTTVGAGDLRDFSGALDVVGTQKGVFVTTSTFTTGARDYVSKVTKRIILIDGDRLTRLMVDHGVGVRTRAVYELKGMDEDYFIEE